MRAPRAPPQSPRAICSRCDRDQGRQEPGGAELSMRRADGCECLRPTGSALNRTPPPPLTCTSMKPGGNEAFDPPSLGARRNVADGDQPRDLLAIDQDRLAIEEMDAVENTGAGESDASDQRSADAGARLAAEAPSRQQDRTVGRIALGLEEVAPISAGIHGRMRSKTLPTMAIRGAPSSIEPSRDAGKVGRRFLDDRNAQRVAFLGMVEDQRRELRELAGNGGARPDHGLLAIVIDPLSASTASAAAIIGPAPSSAQATGGSRDGRSPCRCPRRRSRRPGHRRRVGSTVDHGKPARSGTGDKDGAVLTVERAEPDA